MRVRDAQLGKINCKSIKTRASRSERNDGAILGTAASYDAFFTHARQLEIYSVIHLYIRTFFNNSKNNYNRLITVELLITIVLAVFLSWCVCNDVPSVCVCLMRSPFLTIARSFSFTFHLFYSIHVSESISHSQSFNTHT